MCQVRSWARRAKDLKAWAAGGAGAAGGDRRGGAGGGRGRRGGPGGGARGRAGGAGGAGCRPQAVNTARAMTETQVLWWEEALGEPQEAAHGRLDQIRGDMNLSW